jgi:hypothetical protein
MAQLAKTQLTFDIDYRNYSREASDKAYDDLDAHCAQLRANAPEGSVVGALLQFPRGDGYALYVVTKEKPLVVQHVNIGDAWHVDGITIRGLRLADVRGMVERDRRMAEFFSKKE